MPRRRRESPPRPATIVGSLDPSKRFRLRLSRTAVAVAMSSSTGHGPRQSSSSRSRRAIGRGKDSSTRPCPGASHERSRARRSGPSNNAGGPSRRFRRTSDRRGVAGAAAGKSLRRWPWRNGHPFGAIVEVTSARRPVSSTAHEIISLVGAQPRGSSRSLEYFNAASVIIRPSCRRYAARRRRHPSRVEAHGRYVHTIGAPRMSLRTRSAEDRPQFVRRRGRMRHAISAWQA